MVQQKLRCCDVEIGDFLADPDLVEGSDRECSGGNGGAEHVAQSEFGVDECHSDAYGCNGEKGLLRDFSAEKDEVEKHDGGRCHHFGELVKADSVEG